MECTGYNRPCHGLFHGPFGKFWLALLRPCPNSREPPTTGQKGLYTQHIFIIHNYFLCDLFLPLYIESSYKADPRGPMEEGLPNLTWVRCQDLLSYKRPFSKIHITIMQIHMTSLQIKGSLCKPHTKTIV